MKSLYLVVVLLFFLPVLMIGQTVSGDLMRWHKITIDFEGPNTSETANTNPFSDYRLDVTFTNGNLSYVVPGFYAGCNDAEESSCDSGNVWRVHFSPNQTGTWNWSTEFVTGSNVAVNDGGSSAGFMDGNTGSFNVTESNKAGRDHRNKDKGRLQYVGEHYLRYSGTNPNNPNGDWFVKGGADSPENALAYDDFDDTPNRGGRRKSWEPHQQDYEASDASEYTWKQGQGTGLLGTINYLANKGVNAFSFLTFNVDGDDQNVFPHRLKVGVDTYNEIAAEIINGIRTGTQWNQGVYKVRFDVSKLAQWEKIFEYADKRGMFMHFKTMETENDHLMDDVEIDPTVDSEADQFGGLGRERKLYYRELIARFGHHLALNWNLSEESEIPTEMVIDIASYIKSVDPYDHHIVLHTYPGQWNQQYTPLLGDLSELTGASIQTSNYNIHGVVKDWVDKSREAGKKWVVACDEPGNASIGINQDDPEDNYDVRSQVLWPTFMAGGTGVEYYYGYQTGETDLSAQDHRSRDTKYTHVANTLSFFNNNLQDHLPNMISSDAITSDTNDYVYADSGNVYVVYRPNGGTTELSLPSGNDNYDVQWYNPRTGENLTTATSLGDELTAPSNDDWVALIKLSEPIVPINIPGLIEAENFTAQSGVQTESTQDTGGGSNIGFIQEGDYVEYLIDVTSAGSYEMDFRIASDTSGGDIIIESNENQVGEVTVSGTDGWQNWENVTTTVDLIAGEQTLRLHFEGDADAFLFNLNHITVEEFDEDDTSSDECMPLEVNGVVAVEAENYVRQTRTDQRQWYLQDGSGAPIDDHDESHHETASSGGYLEILPDTRVTDEDQLIVGENFTNTSGEIAVIDYEVMFTTPGTYFVFVRAYSTGPEDNGIHVGVDINESNNNWPAAGNKMQWCRGKNEWTWESRQRDTGGAGGGACGIDETIYLEIPSAGMHTISFSMREDGFEIDKFVLSQEFNRPDGEGPEVVLTNCDDTLSVDSSSVEDNFSMFPNPAKDVLNFSEIPAGTKVRIFNMLGALQTEILIDSGQTSIDTSSLTSGFYLINFSNTENGFKDIGTRKLIIE